MILSIISVIFLWSIFIIALSRKWDFWSIFDLKIETYENLKKNSVYE